MGAGMVRTRKMATARHGRTRDRQLNSDRARNSKFPHLRSVTLGPVYVYSNLIEGAPGSEHVFHTSVQCPDLSLRFVSPRIYIIITDFGYNQI